ncbi:MAG: hypothetical protein FWD61_11985 [Phycisphaerales bacterium]|nr:hypothetical protein [Phycisphaerales bacterium]
MIFFRTGLHPREQGRLFTSSDWTELKAFIEIRPSGENGDDFRAAIIAQALNGGKLSDYMPIQRKLEKLGEENPPSDDELKAKLAAAIAGA